MSGKLKAKPSQSKHLSGTHWELHCQGALPFSSGLYQLPWTACNCQHFLFRKTNPRGVIHSIINQFVEGSKHFGSRRLSTLGLGGSAFCQAIASNLCCQVLMPGELSLCQLLLPLSPPSLSLFGLLFGLFFGAADFASIFYYCFLYLYCCTCLHLRHFVFVPPALLYFSLTLH